MLKYSRLEGDFIMSEYKKIENCKAELKCTLEGEKWADAQKAAFKKIAAKVEVKGFRKGQAPKNLVEKYVSSQEVLLEAAESLAQEALTEAIKEHSVELIDRPQLKLDEINDDKCVLTFECTVTPDVTLGDYKAIEYKVEEVKVEDKDVDDDIAKLLDRKADLELVEDGAVEEGNTAVIDFEGFVDDVAFEGGKGENYDLVIGSHSFIPGFEEQLVGMKTEETKEIQVKFPEDYQAENLKGKDATFKVTVHEIKKKVLPLLDDEFVKEQKITDVNTVDELKAYTKKYLTEEKERQATNKAEEDLMNKLAEITTVDIPEIMMKSEIDSMVQNYEQRMAQQGFTLAQFMELTGQTMDQLRDSMKEDATKRIKINLALTEIAKKDNIEVNEEDINAEYDKMATMYGMPVDDIKKYIPEENLKDDLKLQRTLDSLKK